MAYGAIMNTELIKENAQKLLRSKIKGGFTGLTIHSYKNEIGNFVYAKVRLDNPATGEKIIRPLSFKDGTWSLKDPILDTKKPLYNLDNLGASPMIYFVEGEKCADKLINLGLTATTSGSTTSHTNTDFKPLQNKTVILWADNDQPGKKHTTEVSKILSKLNCRVYEVDIEPLNLDSGEDVCDWLIKNPELDVDSITNLTKTELISSSNKPQKEKLDHLETALAVVNHFGNDNLIYASSATWRWDNSGVWKITDDRGLKKAINNICREEGITAPIVASILDMVKTEIYLADHLFDKNNNFINCKNGELRYTKSGWELTPHNKKNYRTSIIPVMYDGNAKAPRFEQFLKEIFNGDSDINEKINIVLEALGYSLVPDTFLEKFIILVGSGANGKSVLLAICREMLGTKNVSAVQPDQYNDRFQRGHLRSKLANIVTEIKEGGEIADAQLKSLVSGELTTAENKHKDPFEFIPIATHWFGTNHMPHTRDFSDALFRRAIILTFNNKFEGPKRDAKLTQKLIDEIPGIFNLALDGLARLYDKQSFTECQSGKEALGDWRLEADQAAQFVGECCHKDPSSLESIGDLYEKYKKWAEDSGIKRPLNKRNLSDRLVKLGFDRDRTSLSRNIHGIAIKVDFTASDYVKATRGF